MKIRFRRTDFGAALSGAFLCMVILFLISLYRNGGKLHEESTVFFINYLDGRSPVSQIFDPLRNDWGFYQARELSYLFDAFDARFIAFLLKKKIIWFHSLCSLLLCGGMIFIQQYWTRKFFPSVPGILVTLISLFFVLSAPVSGIDYFRCAKYLTALGLWGAFFSGYASFRFGRLSAKVCFLLSLLLMTLSDRQGFYFTAVIAGSSAALMAWQSLKNAPAASLRMRFITLGSLGVTCFGIINNLFLTPAVIRSVNGYDPDFSYQKELAVGVSHLSRGFYYFFGNIGSWFNNFTGTFSVAAVTGVLLTGGIALELLRQYRRGKRRCIHLAILWGCFTAAMFICSVIMVARLKIMMEADLFYGMYTMTFMVIVLALLIFTAAGSGRTFCKVLAGFFCLAIFLRLGGTLSSDKFISEQNLENAVKVRQEIFNKAIKDPAFDEKKYILPYRMELFLEFYRKHILTKP